MVIKEKGLLTNRALSISLLGKSTLFKSPVKQQGIVLIVALVFLVALTAVAAALMQNTTSDMKMAGASNEKVIATQGAISAIDEIINNQLNIRPVGGDTNLFTQGLNFMETYTSAQLLPVDTETGATATANVINNQYFEAYPCPRASVSSSIGIMCNVIQLQAQRPYGRKDTSTVVVNVNIVQQLLPKN